MQTMHAPLPFCLSLVAVLPLSAATYVIGGFGSANCPWGSELVMDLEECSTASQAMGKSAVPLSGWYGTPVVGCVRDLRYSDQLVHNSAYSTQHNPCPNCAPICKEVPVSPYVIGGIGSANCPWGSELVMDLEECSTASQAMGKSAVPLSGWYGTPAVGCVRDLRYSDQLVHNSAYSSLHNPCPNCAPICKEVPVSPYTVGEVGATKCPSGFTIVADRQECSEASQAMGKSAVPASGWYGTPIVGCVRDVRYSDQLVHNSAYSPAHTPCPSCAPICKEALTSSPTVSPTRRPTSTPSAMPTGGPTLSPTPLPTVVPTQAPSDAPTTAPWEALCNGKPDGQGCVYYQLSPICTWEGIFGAHLRQTCPVACDSCFPTTTTTTATSTSSTTVTPRTCNGVPDPRDCQEGAQFCQRNGILGEFARKHCPATCDTCESTTTTPMGNRCIPTGSWTSQKCNQKCNRPGPCSRPCRLQCSSCACKEKGLRR